jgi:hypothetical protein
MTSTITLTAPWIIATEDYADYACETCAREWAEAQGIPAVHGQSYQREKEGHGVIAEAYEIWPYAEADYPLSCSAVTCNQWLKTELTSDGVAYMEEQELPEAVKQAYRSYAV